MKTRLAIVLALTMLRMLLTVSSSPAQEDRIKALVGKWEGTVQWATTAEGTAYGGSDRTLIVESVEQKEGKWVATGRFGLTGKGLGKVQIEIEDSGGRTGISFSTSANTMIRLSLSGTKQLTGTTTLQSTGPRMAQARGNDRPLNLEKKD